MVVIHTDWQFYKKLYKIEKKVFLNLNPKEHGLQISICVFVALLLFTTEPKWAFNEYNFIPFAVLVSIPIKGGGPDSRNETLFESFAFQYYNIIWEELVKGGSIKAWKLSFYIVSSFFANG